MASFSFSNAFSNVIYTDFVLRTVDNTQKLVLGTGSWSNSNACMYISNNTLGIHKPPKEGIVFDCMNALQVDFNSNVYVLKNIGINNATVSNLNIGTSGYLNAKNVNIHNIGPLSDTINIGTDSNVANINIGAIATPKIITIGGGASIINIGQGDDDINISGGTIIIQSSNLESISKTIVLNKQGSDGTGGLCGFEIKENDVSMGYIKTSFDRESFLFKTPMGTEMSLNMTNCNAAFNTNQLVLASNNKVGIGTLSPSSLLTVAGDIQSTTKIITPTLSVTSEGFINSLSASNVILYADANISNLSASNALVKKLSVISMDFPDPSDINGKLLFNKFADNDNQINALGYSNNAVKFQVDSGSKSFVFSSAVDASSSKELMRLTGQGFLGIGTTTPSCQLHVNGNATVSNTLFANYLKSSSLSNLYIDPSEQSGWTQINCLNSNGGVSFLKKHVISSNIGLGNLSPQYLLDVSGTGNFQNIRVSGNDGILSINSLTGQFGKSTLIGEHVKYNPTNDKFTIYTNGTDAGCGALISTMGSLRFFTGTFPGQISNFDITSSNLLLLEQMTITNNVGIGTSTPQTKLHVNGLGQNITTRLTCQSNFLQAFELEDDTGNRWLLYRPSNNANLKIGNSVRDMMTFYNNSGNIGIGTNDPIDQSVSAKLHVNDIETNYDVFRAENSRGSMRFTSQGQLKAYYANNLPYFTATNQNSDSRLKTNIRNIENSLDTIKKMQGVTFDFIPGCSFNDKRQIGLIAQNVMEVLPEVVEEDDESGYLRIHYEKMVPVLIEGIKSLTKIVEEQGKIIHKLQSV